MEFLFAFRSSGLCGVNLNGSRPVSPFGNRGEFLKSIFRQHCLLSPSCFYRYFCVFFFGFNANKTKRKANTRHRKKAALGGRGRAVKEAFG